MKINKRLKCGNFIGNNRKSLCTYSPRPKIKDILVCSKLSSSKFDQIYEKNTKIEDAKWI